MLRYVISLRAYEQAIGMWMSKYKAAVYISHTHNYLNNVPSYSDVVM